MSDESTQAEASQLENHEDIDTTPTQGDEPVLPTPPGQWAMPKPVFRQSSGKLPSGFTKNYGAPDQSVANDGEVADAATAQDAIEAGAAAQQEPPAPASSADAPPASLPAIEPQPDLSEELDLTDVVEPVTLEKGSSSGGLGKVMIVLLVILLLGVIAAAFIGIVWFLLLPGSENTVG